MGINLRSYQKKALELTKNSFMQNNKKICLTLCTGAGKSIIARKIVEGSLAKKKSVIYLTYRTVLIEQMKKTFEGLEVEYGTLQKHGKTPTKHYDLVIIDEVHWSHGSKLQNNINCDYLIGLSATPITPEGYALDFDEIIDVVQLKDLIDLGYASPARVLSTSKVDTKKLKGGKDFTMKSSFDMMNKSNIVRDLVNVYNTHAKGLKTIIYAVNIEHAEHIKAEFQEANIEADTVHSKKDSKHLIQRFRDNDISVLINVDILTTGLDLPDIYCLILASPTKSLIKATQIYGRCTRLNPEDPNKEALIIDCCEVIKNTQHPYQRFDFTKKKGDKKAKTCKCGDTMKVINKDVKMIDSMIFRTTITYRCDLCNVFDETIKDGVVNLSLCEGCGDTLQEKNLEYKQSATKIEFVFSCECGHDTTHREIILTDKELKEITHNEVKSGGDSWEKVELILKEIGKELKYHWKWSAHKITALRESGKTPEAILAKIEDIKAKGHKLSAVAYL